MRQVADSEEERFSATLGKGLMRFDEAKERAEGARISGDDAFALSDTFGIPREQIQEWAAEAGLTVDMDRFADLLQEQRERARRARKKLEVGLEAGAVPPTEFVGYAEDEADAPIALLLDDESQELPVAEEGQQVRVFLGRTPFYAEGGGQVGDQGLIRTDTGLVRVTDTVPAGGHSIMHLGTVESGEVVAGQQAQALIDRDRREATARSHTSTHVVHATLKQILGDHARQAGSLVAPGRLRFDFPHPSAVPGDTLEEAELEANRRLALRRSDHRLRDVDGRSQGARGHDAVRREVRRRRPRRGDRGLLPGTLRGHPRGTHGQRRDHPHPRRSARSAPACAASKRSWVPTRSARSTPNVNSCAASWRRSGSQDRGVGRWSTLAASSRRTSGSRASSVGCGRATAMR